MSVCAGSGLPVWIAFTLEDSPAQRLRGGEGVADAAAWAAAQPEVEAVLLNCCAPEAISAALPALSAAVRGCDGAPLWRWGPCTMHAAMYHARRPEARMHACLLVYRS